MKIAHILDILAPRRGRRAVVLCDGPPPAAETLASCLHHDDLFIATDAAGQPFNKLSRPPDVVIGDFDTLGTPPDDNSTTQFIHAIGQNTTDSEKALDHAAQAGCVDALVLGALGGLFDHSLSNAALPERFSWLLNVILVSDDDVTIRVAAGDQGFWDLPPQTLISLTPVGPGARGVDFDGVRWPLKGADLSWAGASTISNHVVDTPTRLSVSGGSLLFTVRKGLVP